jgi:shikimate kinase
MKTSIALIGFMGTGKTTVAKVLAQKLGKAFIELDAIIVKKAGKPIPEIFRQDGEIRFRELEIEVVSEVAAKKNVVIACGGGVVLNTINIDRLRKESVIIYLSASPAAILKRTSNDKSGRPLLDVIDRAQQIKTLLKSRQSFYRRAADIIVNTSGLNIESVADKILELLKNYESHDK